MTAAIGPGDQVEFIGPRPGPDHPEVGSVWTCAAILPIPGRCMRCGSEAVLLPRGLRSATCLALWKPLFKPPATFMDQFRAPAPAQQPGKVDA